MGIAKTDYHAVRKKVLRHGLHGTGQDGNQAGQVDVETARRQVREIGKVAHHDTGIPRRFGPYPCEGIETVVGQVTQRPLPDGGTVQDTIHIVIPPLPVGIGRIGLQDQGYVQDETGLDEVPVVVGHAVVYDVVRPLLECRGINVHLLRQGALQIAVEKVVKRHKGFQRILVDYLESGHPHERLLVSVVEVLRDPAVVDARHVRIEHAGGQPGIRLFARHPPKESGIAGYAQDFGIDALDHRPRLADAHPLALLRVALRRKQEAPGIFGIRLQLLQRGTYIVGSMAAGAGQHDRRGGRLRASGMVEIFSADEYLRGMGLPIHLQAGDEPLLAPLHVGIRPFAQAAEDFAGPRLGTDQFPGSLLARGGGQIARMPRLRRQATSLLPGGRNGTGRKEEKEKEKLAELHREKYSGRKRQLLPLPERGGKSCIEKGHCF